MTVYRSRRNTDHIYYRNFRYLRYAICQSIDLEDIDLENTQTTRTTGNAGIILHALYQIPECPVVKVICVSSRSIDRYIIGQHIDLEETPIRFMQRALLEVPWQHSLQGRKEEPGLEESRAPRSGSREEAPVARPGGRGRRLRHSPARPAARTSAITEA